MDSWTPSQGPTARGQNPAPSGTTLESPLITAIATFPLAAPRSAVCGSPRRGTFTAAPVHLSKRSRQPLPPSSVSWTPEGQTEVQRLSTREVGSSLRPLWRSAGKIAVVILNFGIQNYFDWL
ncbi:unnamed protein product [Gulo gulo]|uniref:Uncharacterized protein n=1 Tax=Gulo gulo TaxID=48420 RepID=A0A9X9Q4R0_GULGU|nr:unnamed protein product [Gulo gulo]